METKEKKIISENNNIPRTKMQIDEAALQSIEPAAVLDSAIVPIRDFVSPEELHRDLIEIIQKYHPSADISMVEKAYQIAAEAHKTQVRKSGGFEDEEVELARENGAEIVTLGKRILRTETAGLCMLSALMLQLEV